MRRFGDRCLVVVLTLCVCLPAAGKLCAIDPVPGATLLLPYFEVDISDETGDGSADGTGTTTLLTIQNAVQEPTLVHVTVWTDWAFQVLDFDVYLTGYDTVPIDLFQIIGLGNLPVTADLANDPDDTISPNHNQPVLDASFPGCAGIFPFPEPIVTGALLDRVQNSVAGFPVPTLGGIAKLSLREPGVSANRSRIRR